MKSCAVCESSIPEAAIYCIKCKHYQKIWKNELKYWSGIVGLIVFTGAVISYILGALPDIRKSLVWVDNVKVLELLVPGKVVLGNYGDGPVFIESLIVKPKTGQWWQRRHFPIQERVEVGEIISVDVPKTSNINEKEYSFIRNADEETFDKAINEWVLGNDCFKLIMQKEGGLQYELTKTMIGDQANIIRVPGVIRYF